MMTRSALVLSFALALALPALDVGCSSSDNGGPTGAGGSATGGTTSTGGTTATGGSPATGGTAGAGGRGGNAGSSGGGGATATLMLTSTAFTEGMMIPTAQTCTGNSNMSPPLTWTAGPSATMSYGPVLHDMTNDAVHWVIWDIPATTTSLPGNLPTTQKLTTPVMAQQHNTFGSDGYYGPCPSGSTHTYVFEVYALDVATLPSVTATSQTKTIRTTMMSHALAMGTLSGTSNASR